MCQKMMRNEGIAQKNDPCIINVMTVNKHFLLLLYLNFPHDFSENDANSILYFIGITMVEYKSSITACLSYCPPRLINFEKQVQRVSKRRGMHN